jgi:hypothetical protein
MCTGLYSCRHIFSFNIKKHFYRINEDCLNNKQSFGLFINSIAGETYENEISW